MTIRILFAAAAFAMSVVAAQADDAHPWVQDKALIDRTVADVQSGGILAVKPHVGDLETALAGAKHSMDLAAAGDGDTHYVLTDGPGNTLMALMMAATDKSHPHGQTLAVPNPYPAIAFYLGSYYDEIGKPEEADRVLSAGLGLPGSDTSAQRPDLLVEHGASLAAQKRWADSLASYDEGLKIPDLEPAERAYMYRGRGFALTELSRLDDAQASYEESLKLDPGNARAQHELDYIAGLKKGAMPEPSTAKLSPVQPQGVSPPPDAPAH